MTDEEEFDIKIDCDEQSLEPRDGDNDRLAAYIVISLGPYKRLKWVAEGISVACASTDPDQHRFSRGPEDGRHNPQVSVAPTILQRGITPLKSTP